MTNLLESCRIAPPSAAVAELSLPLTFLDIIWLPFHPIRRLLFYEFPCSESYFLETLIPQLKQSLSITLKHYLPLAGNLVYPLNTESEKPIIRYVEGDSVSLTIFESTNDFDNLVGNHARDADTFYEFIPQLPPIIDEPKCRLLQILAVQVTLFPGRGICIGLANHHVVGDATSVVGFVRAWASMCKLGGDEEYLNITQGESLPLFDRSLIKDPHGVDTIFWNQIKEVPLQASHFPLPTNRVRATYVLSPTEMKKLKALVLARIPGLVHVSSFVVMTAYVWTCLAKSRAGEEQNVDENEPEFFLFAVDARTRLDPPLPENYFGNCLSYGLVNIKHQELVADEGFIVAAKTIAEEIQHKVNNKDKIMEGPENWITEVVSALQKRSFSVSGSARVDLYSADFGWGNARKLETLSIDGEEYSMSLCKSRDYEGGLEIGLSLPKVTMDAFASVYAGGIKRS